MANYSRWEDIKKRRDDPTPEVRVGIEKDLALGQLIYDLRTEAGLSQRALAERMGTTQSVISRLEEGGGAKNRLDTLARLATALNRHLVVSFPEKDGSGRLPRVPFIRVQPPLTRSRSRPSGGGADRAGQQIQVQVTGIVGAEQAKPHPSHRVPLVRSMDMA